MTELRANAFSHLRPGHLLGAAALCLIATVLFRWWLAPASAALPDDYSADTYYTAKLRSHRTPSSPAEEFTSVVRRHDQVLTGATGHAIVQGDAHWVTPAGKVVFETINTYGVDRRTRENVAAYGNEARTGQYLFPPNVQKLQYKFWDPLYAGEYVATFAHAEQFHGVEVLVFDTTADGIDESAGYTSLPDVPRNYRALTFGNGLLRVEPVSGIVVDHQDAGVSYFIDPKTGDRIGQPINEWNQRFTAGTIAAQLVRAKSTRARILALELWLPLAFVAMASILLIAGMRAARRSPR